MPATSLPQTLVTQVPSVLLGSGQVEGGRKDVVTVVRQRRRTFGWLSPITGVLVDHLRTHPPDQSQENEPLANPFPVPFPLSARSLSPPATDRAVREGTGSHEAGSTGSDGRWIRGGGSVGHTGPFRGPGHSLSAVAPTCAHTNCAKHVDGDGGRYCEQHAVELLAVLQQLDEIRHVPYQTPPADLRGPSD